MQTRHFLISGHVQGVGFRYAFEAEARRLGLNGWVRNKYSGEVEALVSGTNAAIEAISLWAWQGSKMAHVENVVFYDSPEIIAAGFFVKSSV